jgi:S1-C subfamily serine protease
LLRSRCAKWAILAVAAVLVTATLGSTARADNLGVIGSYRSGKARFVVQQVIAGSQADDLNVQAGDVIVRVNGQYISSQYTIHSALATSPASLATLGVYRNGSYVELPEANNLVVESAAPGAWGSRSHRTPVRTSNRRPPR